MRVGDVPTAVSVLRPHWRSLHWLLGAFHAYLCMAAGCHQVLPWTLWRVMWQFSVSRAVLQPGSSKDLLKYHLLAFSLASELFVASRDMKITYRRGMILLLLKKSGFCLSSERAVTMGVFLPLSRLCSSAVQWCSGARLGTGRLCNILLEALLSIAQPCTSETVSNSFKEMSNTI